MDVLKKLYFILILGVASYCFGGCIPCEIDQAVLNIQEFKGHPATSIPPEVLRNARGFVFISSARSGIVVAKINEGWSAPSAIEIKPDASGSEVVQQNADIVLVLNSKAAVDAFAREGNITLGTNLGIAPGPVGKTSKFDLELPPAAIYSYMRVQGVFVGVSLKGVVFVERAKDNTEFYGRAVTPAELLFGNVPPPKGTEALYKELAGIKNLTESNVSASPL